MSSNSMECCCSNLSVRGIGVVNGASQDVTYHSVHRFFCMSQIANFGIRKSHLHDSVEDTLCCSNRYLGSCADLGLL